MCQFCKEWAVPGLCVPHGWYMHGWMDGGEDMWTAHFSRNQTSLLELTLKPLLGRTKASVKIRLEQSPVWLQVCRMHGPFHLSPAVTFHLFPSAGNGMKQVKILGEVHSAEAVRGQPSSYFEEKLPETDVTAELELFFLFFFFLYLVRFCFIFNYWCFLPTTSLLSSNVYWQRWGGEPVGVSPWHWSLPPARDIGFKCFL